MEMPRIIFVDDEQCMRDTSELVLKNKYGENRAFDLEFYHTPEKAIEEIQRNPFNVALVFMDHHFKIGQDELLLGCNYIKTIKQLNSYIEIVMMSADESNETLRLWLKNGADKFIYKDSDQMIGKVQVFINEALTKFHAKFGKLLGNKKVSLNSVSEAVRKTDMISVSPQMETIAELVLQCAKHEISILLVGETGTGKELIAKATHKNSKRAEKEFRTIDCTQFKNSQIIQSELFGSEKGAFTGAESKIGLLEVANGGTVFLDEAHHLGPEGQAMLLRFLQDKKVRKVGGKVEKTVDVRFVFAAKPNIRDMVNRGEFLPDLYYRMKEVTIDLPRLIERDGDLEVLSEYFLEIANSKNGHQKRFHPDTLDMFRQYEWPGNVRELENLMKRLSVLVTDAIILPRHILKFGELDIDESKLGFQEILTLEELQARQDKEKIKLILKAYEMGDFNWAEAARLLGIPRTSLRNYCKALGIRELMETTVAKHAMDEEKEKHLVKQSWRSLTSFFDRQA